MKKPLQWSFANYKSGLGNLDLEDDLRRRITSWLSETGLFEQAWSAVSLGPINWWWSEQLCLFTVGAWTSFLATEGIPLFTINTGSLVDRNNRSRTWNQILVGIHASRPTSGHFSGFQPILLGAFPLSASITTSPRQVNPEICIARVVDQYHALTCHRRFITLHHSGYLSS